MAVVMGLLAGMVKDICYDLLLYSRRIILGIGKSTLLRHIAMREVPVPAHITILFVEQEVCLLFQHGITAA